VRSPLALVAGREQGTEGGSAERRRRPARASYAASAFFEDDDFSDFFDESDDEDESLFESFLDSLFSPPSFPDRSSSRLRRFVP
jgi:hypothetical protein